MGQNVKIKLTIAASSLYKESPGLTRSNAKRLVDNLSLLSDDNNGLYDKEGKPVDFKSEVFEYSTVTWEGVSLDSGYTVEIDAYRSKSRVDIMENSFSFSGSPGSQKLIGTVNNEANGTDTEYLIIFTIYKVPYNVSEGQSFSIDPILRGNP